MAERLAKKVLVIGWDAADWKVINPLLDAGLLPALERLINNGAMGNIATLDPPLSPILWTSIATGKTADKHGILNFVEPMPDGTGLRPVSVTSRKVKAIWNILTQQGMKTHLVGWWPSHPAEPINGICVSNFFQKMSRTQGEWKLPGGAVHPAEFESALGEYRVDVTEITSEMLLPFVPDAAKIDQKKDRSLITIARLIAEASSIHAAATWIAEHENDWDFMGVYFDTIDHFCHGFMKYHPPKQDGIPDEYFELYKDVVSGAYRFQDMMLERMLKLAGEDTTVILLSDHGFHSDHLRPKKLPKDPVAPALEHSPYGILCISGPNIVRDERIFGANLLDITPTILMMFGLPVGKDMDGKPLLQVFSRKAVPEYIDSWENVAGNCGMHPADKQEDPWAAQEAMQQLIELGYVEPPGEDKQKHLSATKDETDFILAKVHAGSRRYQDAITILEKLYRDNPHATRYALKLAHCYQLSRNIPALRKLIDELKEKKPDNLPHLDYLEGTLLLFENKPRKALERLQEAEKKSGGQPLVHIQIGTVYNKIGQWDLAENSFCKAILLDQNNAHAHLGLAVCHLKKQNYEAAANAALDAVGLLHHFPEAHYYLGESLYFLGDYTRAAQAFEVAVHMRPGYRKAHQWLVKIYSENLSLPQKADFSRNFVSNNIKGTITVVSGLPRSGTSMMMQMLHSGGAEVLTDNVRQDDESNPRGYFELERVKRLAGDSSWLPEADGKVLKIISPLLQYLRPTCNYKIIFMQRDLYEVMRSQQKMLGKDPGNFPAALAETFRQQLEKTVTWLHSQPNIEVLFLNYRDIIEEPEEHCENVRAFLGLDLNISKMIAAVDSRLYRNR